MDVLDRYPLSIQSLHIKHWSGNNNKINSVDNPTLSSIPPKPTFLSDLYDTVKYYKGVEC